MTTNFSANKKLLETKILKREDISNLMIKIWITKPSEFSFKPGQYCTLGADGIERPYSIASSPQEDTIELFVELVEENEGGILTPIIWKIS